MRSSRAFAYPATRVRGAAAQGLRALRADIRRGLVRVLAWPASADASAGALRVPLVYRLREPAARAAYHGVGFGELEVEQAATGYARRSATCLTPRDMQPENTRHAVNLNDRRTRQTTNGTTQMLIHPLPTAHTRRQTLLRRTRQGPREGERHHHPTGVWRHTQAAPRPMTSGHRQRGRAPLPPLPPARHPRPSMGPRT